MAPNYFTIARIGGEIEIMKECYNRREGSEESVIPTGVQQA